MSSKNVSRRSLVPSLTAGAVGALAVSTPPSPAAAAAGRNQVIACGPCKIWPGHNLSLQCFLLPGPRSARASQVRLNVLTLDGNELVAHDFALSPGTGVEAELAVDANGTVRFNGKVVQANGLSLDLTLVYVILTLYRAVRSGIAAAAGGGAKLQATATSFVPGKAPGEQNVDYILPFIEQD